MKAAIIPALLWLATFPRTESGTLIVVNTSKDEIVVAADSRSYNKTAQFDDRCKITALGTDAAFASAGKTAFLSDNRATAWESHEVARTIFDRITKETAGRFTPTSLADAWGKEVAAKLKADLERDRNETLFGITEPGVLTQGVFAGFDQSGPLIAIATVKYQIAEEGKVETDSSVSEWRNRAVQIGRNEIASELFARQTDRAKAWAGGLSARPGLDGTAVPAIEAVEYSIEHYAPVYIGNRMIVPIGGPVDALKLIRGGHEWLKRKPACTLGDQ